MTEQEIEELLGAYALDAVDPGERAEIEAHLAICPRCRSEVAEHREVAALLASSSVAAPVGLWDRIADELSPDLPDLALNSRRLIAHLRKTEQHGHRRSRAFVGAMIGVAAVTLVIVLLSLQIANLNRQVNSSGTANGISAAVKSVLAHPHRTVILTSATSGLNATVAIAPDGEAYWVDSNLAQLPKSKTYQVWAEVRGKTAVSLGVLGPNPNISTGFRLESDMSRLMVTVEPEGGTTTPTPPELLSAAV